MLQKPLAPVKPPRTWPETQWQDMKSMDVSGPKASVNKHALDQGASALKLVGGTTSKPKVKLTGIKIGGKQVTLPKAATPPPPAPLPEYLNKLVTVVKKANKLLKKPLQPLPEALLIPPAALPLLTPCYSEKAGTSGEIMPAQSPLPSALQPQPTPALHVQNERQQEVPERIAAVRVTEVPEARKQHQEPAQDTAAPMDFHQWMQASRRAAERQRGPEQDVGRPKAPAVQEAAAQVAKTRQPMSEDAPALSPEAFVGTPPDQDPASPAGSCNAAHQSAPVEEPRGASPASVEDATGPMDVSGQTSASQQCAAPSKQQQQVASGEGTSAEAEAGPGDAQTRSKSLPQSQDAAAAAPVDESVAAAAAQRASEQRRASSKSRDDSPSSSSSSDDSSSSSSESSSSDSDTSSSDHSSSLSGVPLLSGQPKASSPSGSKRPAEAVCGPSLKRQKSAPAGEPARTMSRLDSVREDGEIKGETARRDMRAEEHHRGGRRTPERHARGSSREERDREKSHARENERRRDDDEHRLRRRSDEYYKMHNWKYKGRQSREREAEDDKLRRDRTLDRRGSIEEERRRRGEERERERQEERRRRDDRERGSGRHSYEYRRRSRSRSRERSRSRQLAGRTRSRDAGDRRRERSRTGGPRDWRTRSSSRDKPRQSERRSRETFAERRRDRPSAEQERRASKESPAAQQPSKARTPENASPGAKSGVMAPPAVRKATKAAELPQKASASEPLGAQPMLVDKPTAAARSSNPAPKTPLPANPAQAAPAATTAHQAQLSSQKPVGDQMTQTEPSALPTTPPDTDSPNDLSEAARAFALALRASMESQAQEGGDSSAELHKQVASRKSLAKMFVEKGLENERQLQALVAAGAEAEDRGKMLREMCSATTEGIMLTLKAQVHFLRWAAVGERMITQGRGADWVAVVQDPAALAAKGMQPKHVLANEYQAFMAELQNRDTRQLFGIAKARFQRAATGNPAEKAFLSKGLQFVELARLFAKRLEMVTAVRMNAFQAPSLKQHEAGLRSVEDAHRQAQRQARQQQPPQLQRGAQGAPRGQQPSPRAFPAGAKQAVDVGETFQRPSPGDSNNSETTASTPPTVQGLQQYITAAVPTGMPGLPPLQALAKADPSAYIIPQRFARSQEVLLNSHQRFMTAYDLAASREIQLMLLTMMEDENAATARAAALVSTLTVDTALMDVMAVPSLGRQCLEGLRALRDSLGLSPAQSAS